MKKNQTVQWCVTFIDNITNEINLMIKYIRKYADGKISLVYTKGITKSITLGFKKDKSHGDWTFLPT
jgi:hypothetical protein